jgi:hypothetical protein
MTYTAGNPHTAGDGQSPEDAHAADRPAAATPHDVDVVGHDHGDVAEAVYLNKIEVGRKHGE